MSRIGKEQILESLKQIKDPSLGKSIVEMNMVHSIEIQNFHINIKLSVPPLTNESKVQLIEHCNTQLTKDFGSEYSFNIHILAEPLATKHTEKNTSLKQVIAVASGKGGVGKSTISVNLACSLARQGYKVGLIDADLYGPSAPTMLGLVGEKPKVRNIGGKQKIIPLQAHGIHLISIGFIIEPDQAVVLRGPRLSGIIKQFVSDCDWPDLDYLIVDLPPGTGDIQLTLVQCIAVTGALVVTTPSELSVSDALRASNMFRMENISVPIIGIVENMSWFQPKELDNRYLIFGTGGGAKLSRLIDSPLLAQIPLIMEAGQNNDSGIPAILQEDHPIQDYFSTFTARFSSELENRNKDMKPTQRVKVNK